MVTWLCNLRNRGVVLRATILGAVVVATLLATAPVAIRLGGSVALAAATIAALLCLAGAAAALLVVDRFRAPNSALAALWISMIIRTGGPFAVGLIVHLHGGPLAQAGLLCYLLVFYPIVLAVGTILALPSASGRPTPAR
jgi:hypothetical protein